MSFGVFCVEDNAFTKMLRRMVESVEGAAKQDVQAFFQPTGRASTVTAEQVQRMVAAMAAFISIVEHGGLEQSLRRANETELLARFFAVKDLALYNTKTSRAILVAALENAFGLARGETAEDRLRRALDMARTESPVYIGSFANFADEPDE
jgi:hypothetical protein